MITAVLLAAGCSSRMGAAPDSKLLLPWGEEDEPLVAEAARRLIAAVITLCNGCARCCRKQSTRHTASTQR